MTQSKSKWPQNIQMNENIKINDQNTCGIKMKTNEFMNYITIIFSISSAEHDIIITVLAWGRYWL